MLERGATGRPGEGPQLERFAGWLTAFGDAWEAVDADAMAALFALGATLQPVPFAEPVRGRRPIGEHWRRELDGLLDVQFAAQVLGAGGTYGIAHWRVSYRVRASATSVVRDGILLAALDARRHCTALRLWWHAIEGSGEA